MSWNKGLNMLRRALSMVLLLCCFFLINSCAYSAINKDGYGFFRTGDMLNTRIYSQAVLLKDGRVFIAGGKIGDPKKNLSFWRTTDTTEIYDPKTGAFSYGPNLNVPREQHAMLTMDDGRVLIAGGNFWSYKEGYNKINLDKKEKYSHIEIYDPKTNTITLGPKLVENSTYENAQILNIGDGEYLIGLNAGSRFAPDTMLYNSKNNTIKEYKNLHGFRDMIYLGNNEIALFDLSSSNVTVIDKKTKKVLKTASTNIKRFMSPIVKLDNGKILVIEGRMENSRRNAEIYDKNTNKYRMVKGTSNTSRYQVWKLGNSKVLLHSLNGTEIFHGDSETFELQDYNLPARCNAFVNINDNTALCAGTINYWREKSKKSYLFKY